MHPLITRTFDQINQNEKTWKKNLQPDKTRKKKNQAGLKNLDDTKYEIN